MYPNLNIGYNVGFQCIFCICAYMTFVELCCERVELYAAYYVIDF